jgi:hypothetical protein
MFPPEPVPEPVTDELEVNVNVLEVGTVSKKKFPCVLAPSVPLVGVHEVDVMGVPGMRPWFVVVVTVTVVPDWLMVDT